jgi:hypothetical protein
MKPINNFLFFFLSLFFLSSCEDVVQIKLDEGSELIVIDAFINDLRIDQKIRITKNSSYFSTTDPAPLTNAVVSLKDLTLNKSYSFNYENNGNYVYHLINSDTIAKTNHQYELSVSLNGITYTSMATQKRSAKIDSVSAIVRDTRSGGFGSTKRPPYICLLFAKDKTDSNADYYWIKTYKNDTLFSGSRDINVCIDGTGGEVYDVSVDSTAFTPPSAFLGFKRYNKNDVCKVEIHSISKDSYLFFIQALAQINNGGLFAKTPENIKTNIFTPKEAKTKAVGQFNMATVASAKKIIK